MPLLHSTFLHFRNVRCEHNREWEAVLIITEFRRE